MCLFWKRGYVIVPRKVFPQESGNQPSKKNRSNSDEGDWYMRLVSVSELVYCNDFSYTLMHTLFIWFFTSQIVHRHKSTCKRCWDLQNSSISKTPSSKTIPHCFPNKPSWSASHLVFQDTFEGLHVILLGDSFSQMFADVCHCFLQLHG